MRLSIREEIAYNRKVTELREKAMAEAIAEIEMEKMLVEMEEYLARSADDSDKKITTIETLSGKGVFDTLDKEECIEKDEICKMLDDLEEQLLMENPDVSSVPVFKREKCNTINNGICNYEEISNSKTTEEDMDQDMKKGEMGTQGRLDNGCVRKENTEPEIERIATVDNILLPVSDMNGNKTELTCVEEPKKMKKHRYLSIFTRRHKNKAQVMENKPLTSSEKNTKKGRSFLQRLKNVFCCCRTEN